MNIIESPQKNTVFFLGAGASANCLPTYSNFPKRFADFFDFLKVHNSDDKEINKLAEDLLSELITHNTPDTIAKKYFHLGRPDRINIIKIILTLYFGFEQSIYKSFTSSGMPSDESLKTPLDKRYDALIATILKPVEGSIVLPGDCKIITWNYDLQVEIALSLFLDQNIKAALHSIQSYTNNDFSLDNYNPKQFGVFHLNGYAYINMASISDSLFGNFLIQDHASKAINSIINNYKALSSPQKPGHDNQTNLSFSWEWFQKKESENFMNAIKAIIKTAENIVIIGYSFPAFNRRVDLEIFKGLGNFKRIYIQSDEGERIKNVLLTEILRDYLLESKIEIIDYTKAFYIPSNLY